jgi:hypothetical protein
VRVSAGARHTPGPWKWIDYPDGRKLLSAPLRAVIHCPDAPMSVEPADAGLIAAAPELLAAAFAARHQLHVIAAIGLISNPEHRTNIERAIALADGAIAKAEGRS